ncbi:MAG: ferredoxin--NADP reductase [Acidobacteria bacterium]|nr:ferredoxin--NADP reductase [Acidobacteriota bacterium]
MAHLKPFISAQLVERTMFSEELGRFLFIPERPVHFRPGQYATIAVPDGDGVIQRAYSIVSSPHEPFLEFFIELVAHGTFTPRIWELRTGDSVLIRERIVGAFVLDPASTLRRRLLIATGTGIAPYMSMARAKAAELKIGKNDGDEFLVLHGGSRATDFGSYREELTGLASDGWLHYVPTVSRPWDDPAWVGETGRVEDVLRKYADARDFSARNAVAYLCGHPDMVEHGKSLLRRATFPKAQVKEEKYFTLPVSPATDGALRSR